MIEYLLDTNICIDLLRGRSHVLFERLRRCKPDTVGLSSITLAELYYGVERSRRPEYHLELLVQFCAPLSLADFDTRAARIYGSVRATLEGRGQPIGPLDTLIASHALALEATLITANEDEFRRVPGLEVVNWNKENP